jgi:hypothetical protein
MTKSRQLKKTYFALVFDVHSIYPSNSGQLAPRKGTK